jgi:hypothetical protein
MFPPNVLRFVGAQYLKSIFSRISNLFGGFGQYVGEEYKLYVVVPL